MKEKANKSLLVLIIFFLIVLIVFGLVGCNKQIFDTHYDFDYAYVDLGNGTVIEGKVESWDDWTDSDMVQVKINGKTYYTHGSNVVFVDY